MTKLFSMFVLFSALISAPAWGQQSNSGKHAAANPTPPARPVPELMNVVPPAPAPTAVPPSSLSEIKATPEMWFYEQYMHEYKDPKNAVRANAAFAAQQRANRLAAMRWFGLSNSRPRISPDPINVYPPAWSSNTPLQPNRWQATGGQPYYVARPENLDVRSY
jgi:hypothetical protein